MASPMPAIACLRRSREKRHCCGRAPACEPNGPAPGGQRPHTAQRQEDPQRAAAAGLIRPACAYQRAVAQQRRAAGRSRPLMGSGHGYHPDLCGGEGPAARPGRSGSVSEKAVVLRGLGRLGCTGFVVAMNPPHALTVARRVARSQGSSERWRRASPMPVVARAGAVTPFRPSGEEERKVCIRLELSLAVGCAEQEVRGVFSQSLICSC